MSSRWIMDVSTGVFTLLIYGGEMSRLAHFMLECAIDTHVFVFTDLRAQKSKRTFGRFIRFDYLLDEIELLIELEGFEL